MPPVVEMAPLRSSARAILPSLLMCDFGHLADEIHRLEEAQVPGLHLDVMDGHFVPNLSYGLPLVAAVRRLTRLPLDVHLMISNPADYVERYRQAGADTLTIHIEAVADPRAILQKIRALGALAGLALNPSTPLSAVAPYYADADLLLVMSVEPGFGGQAFEPVALEKLRTARREAQRELILEVDGGVGTPTIRDCAAAGAQWFVAGSAILAHDNYSQRVAELVRLADEGQATALPNLRSSASSGTLR